jgi:multidrug efflux pump subunit AcrA (membrane-fusion protein)
VLEEASRVAKMEVEVNNSAHILKPGMFARVGVVLAQNESAQVVPSSALVTGHGSGGGAGVYVVESNSQPVARFVPVELGIVAPDKIEIVSPQLTAPVVTLGQHLLSDGSPIILPGSGNDAQPGNGPGRPKDGEGRPAK